MPAKYLFDNESFYNAIKWVPMAHGYIYPVYVLTAIQFATVARWSVRKIIWLILAGTLPVASIVAERKVVKEYS
jgi:integral membrane protein